MTRYFEATADGSIIACDEAGDGLVVAYMAPDLVPEGVTVEAWAPPIPALPTSVTPLQARKALRAAGLKAAVDGYVASLPEEQREEWEYAIEVRRDSPLIAAAAGHLSMTDEQVDNLFRLAASL